MSMVTQKQFKEHFRNLLNGKAVYVWGANGEIITEELMDKLYNCYASSTYNKAYYDNKLKEGLGRIGADCSGAFFTLSKGDKTVKGYYNACSTKGSIKDLPKDTACMVFNANLTHMAAYMGDGTTIEMKSSAENVHEEAFNEARWTYYGIPTWLDTAVEAVTGSDPKVNDAVGTAVANTTMKVRSESNTSESSKTLGYVKQGEKVEVLEILSNGWYKIVWKKAACGYAYTSNAGGGYYTYTANATNTADDTTDEGATITIQLNELKLGSTGKQVAALQCILVGRGYEIGTDPIDGKFGEKTDAGVRQYQKDNKLTVDGVVAGETWNSLLK